MTTKTFEEFMSEINSENIAEALANAEKCLEAFTSEDIIRQQQEIINRQKAEIERLEKDSKRLKKVQMQLDDAMKMYSTIKAEAVKEFAERLKKKAYLNDDLAGLNYMVVDVDDIDNLVKEMECENK